MRSTEAHDFNLVQEVHYSHTKLRQSGKDYALTTPLLGRFVGRDNLGYADSMSVYLMMHSNPLNGLDATGNLTINATGQDLDEHCPNERESHISYIQWKFELSNQRPCDGYFVQRVRLYCEQKDCPCNCFEMPEDAKPVLTIFEAWPFDEQHESLTKMNNNFDDEFRLQASRGRCGHLKLVGEVRFYCKSADSVYDPQNMDPNARYAGVIVEQWQANEAHPIKGCPGFTEFRTGANLSREYPRKPPNFWRENGEGAVEGTPTHDLWTKYECCGAKGGNDSVVVGGSPLKQE